MTGTGPRRGGRMFPIDTKREGLRRRSREVHTRVLVERHAGFQSRKQRLDCRDKGSPRICNAFPPKVRLSRQGFLFRLARLGSVPAIRPFLQVCVVVARLTASLRGYPIGVVCFRALLRYTPLGITGMRACGKLFEECLAAFPARPALNSKPRCLFWTGRRRRRIGSNRWRRTMCKSEKLAKNDVRNRLHGTAAGAEAYRSI